MYACARARSSYSHTSTRIWTLNAPFFTTGNYLRVHMRKRQVTKGRRPCTFLPHPCECGSERGIYCGYVSLHASMKQHIAAAVLSIMCGCVWYIVEHAQARNCCAGYFRRFGAFMVSPVSTSSKVMRSVLGWPVNGCGLTWKHKP